MILHLKILAGGGVVTIRKSKTIFLWIIGHFLGLIHIEVVYIIALFREKNK